MEILSTSAAKQNNFGQNAAETHNFVILAEKPKPKRYLVVLYDPLSWSIRPLLHSDCQSPKSPFLKVICRPAAAVAAGKYWETIRFSDVLGQFLAAHNFSRSCKMMFVQVFSCAGGSAIGSAPAATAIAGVMWAVCPSSTGQSPTRRPRPATEPTCTSSAAGGERESIFSWHCIMRSQSLSPC